MVAAKTNKTVILIKTLRRDADGVKTNVLVFPGTVVEVLDASGEWSSVRRKGAPAGPEGWIISSALSDAPQNDIDDFVENCVLQSLFYGVQAQYLAACAEIRSHIQLKGSAGNEIGPFRLLQSEWDAHRKDDAFGVDFESKLIKNFRFQCAVFALMTSHAYDAIRAALNRLPNAAELYLTQLIGATAAAKLINAPGTTVDAALRGAADSNLPAGSGTREDILKRYDEILGGGAATGEKAIANIKEAFTAACNETRDAVSKQQTDLLEGSEGIVNPETDPRSVLFQKPPEGHAPLKGHLIMKLQDHLIKSGHLTATDSAGRTNRDGFFGMVTKDAVAEFQHDNGLTPTGAVTHELWRKLTGEPSPDIYNLCAQLTGSFEGTNFGGVMRKNSDDTVLTFGYHGLTLTGGNLRLFLKSVDNKFPGLLDREFGADKAAKLRKLFPPAELKDAVAIGRGLFLADPSLGTESEIKEEWRTAFEKFGNIPQVQEEQIEFSRTKCWADAEKMRKKLGFAEQLSHALCFDVAIQLGLEDKIAEKCKAAFGERMSESEKREIFAEEIVKNALPRWQEDVRSRKVGTLVDGAGRVHGGDYELANWGFATPEEGDEPDDIGPPSTVTAAGSDFEQFFRESLPNYTAFAPSDFLVKGGSHKANGLNTDPPRKLWPNVLPLAKLLAAFKARMGNKRITFNSVYRSPDYNKSLRGSAKKSQHMQFRAADIVVHGAGGPSDWALELKRMRSQGEFKGGIGIYRSFVHVDTRGVIADWRG
ncbi:MAG: D-Ala-D-Ala carboxypeptidase family metallohydrolase [Beijerinckiaceae bacterium]|nr:D-Ala-D-Ala carboxypeptidase family metallohydrolase [Beijerinckiaceae bacterium]